MNNRNDFPASVKQMLCLSVSGHCSICGTCTTWVDGGTTKKENIGEAAHIEAAAEGGPRYNPYQTEEQRASFDNGIWLCSNCHTIIDSNPDHYTVGLLRAYKANAMRIAKSNISESLKGEGKVKVQDFTPAMLSYYSMLYGIQESLHNSITEINKFADDLFREYQTENMFYNHYAFESSVCSLTLFPNLSLIKTDLWANKIPPLVN
ncbi:MAG: hypothetical protein IKH75_10450 [Ruminococcus sp.]|nr:hypothetical protein [Ruminococcus sp.]